MRKAFIAALLLLLSGCQVHTAFGPVSVDRGPSFERHLDDRSTQAVHP